MWAPFEKSAPLNSVPLLPEQFYEIEIFNLYKFVFATAAVSCKALRRGSLNGTCIAMIVSL